MAKDRINMPSGMGGLTRYFDEYKSKISFSPGTVVIISIVLIIIIILIHAWGAGFF